MKAFLYTLVSSFTFAEADEKVVKANVYVPWSRVVAANSNYDTTV